MPNSVIKIQINSIIVTGSSNKNIPKITISTTQIPVHIE